LSSAFVMRAQGASSYTPPPGRLTTGSRQQEDIWAELLGSDSHLMVDALAGTGKSSTCREGMHRLLEADPSLSGKLSYVAFNRSIADEFQAGLPSDARATTMHSAGFAAVRAAFPAITEPNKHKLRGIADRLLPRRDNLSRKAKTIAIRLAERCKSQLIGAEPSGQRYGIGPNVLRRIASEAGLDCRGLEGTAFGLVDDLIRLSLKETASVDFTDMVWFPVMLELDFPSCEVLFIDECQDLDPCQHALVTRMAGDGRMVVCGDPHQAIYAFRGADSRSMDTLGAQLSHTRRGLERLPLTATRRCPKSHVKLAQKIVPAFESLPGAPSGRWEADADPNDVIEPGWMVLCRKNAPLLGLAFQSVARGIPVAIQGKDIGEQLGRFVDDLPGNTLAELLRSVESYRASELAKLSEMDDADEEISLVNDRCNCVRAASVGASTPADVSAKIRSLFKDVSKAEQDSYVLFSSIHRAKGREAEKVAILEPEGMPSPFARSPSAIEQELNLIYVGITRSKHRLTFLGPLPLPLSGA
jgi:DNA helicase-2/ATP-dependent DNA helicase PcrA